MSEIITLIAPPRRPKILLEAARICARGYNREKMLPRLQGASTAAVLAQLEMREADMNEARRTKAITYSAQAHVEVLSALLAESEIAA